MSSINTMWGILMQGDSYDPQEISRRVARGVFKESTEYLTTLNALVPYKDQILRSFQVEQLVRLVLAGILRERALAFDPINTYEKSTLVFPPPGSLNTTMPNDSRIVHQTEPDAFEEIGNGQVVFHCSVVPAAGSFTTQYGLRSFTMTNNLSSLIAIEGGFKIRMKGDIGAAPFTFDLSYIGEPSIDWLGLYNRIKAMHHVWTDADLRDIYVNDVYWHNQLAAVIMNSLENSLK